MTWVAVQLALFIALAVLPGSPLSWTSPGIVVAALGLAIVLWSSLRLGRSLTPFPRPAELGRFTAAGPYRFVRHPIYVGVLLTGIGFAAATHSASRFAVIVILAAFFDVKSRYEERALRRRYHEYLDYARRTRRFVPFVY